MSNAIAGAQLAPSKRWLQLLTGVLCMATIANLQYSWTLFVVPMSTTFGWTQAGIQIAFTIFVLLETWLVPLNGWFVDRYGPGVVVTFGGVLVAIGWSLNSFASSLSMLYLGSALTGIGAAAVYGAALGNALKWFPDRRGLAAGFTVAGFGAGAALTVIPVRMVIAAYGYQTAFLWFGLAQGVVLLVLSILIHAPKSGEVPAVTTVRVQQSSHQYTPGEVLRTKTFWLLYGMFVLVVGSGLIATAQLAPIAKDFKIADMPVDLLFLTSTTLSAALVVDNILNAAGRPFFGWVSDYVGREVTMVLAFSLGAISYLGLGEFGANPYVFILLAGMIFFTWGEIASLFPATCTDLYGTKYATTNAGMLYTAKGTASILVPLASMLRDYTGTWTAVFQLAAAMNIIVVVLAMLVLRPMRTTHHAASDERRAAAT